MLDSFKSALEAVDGSVRVAHDYAEVVKIIREICYLENVKSVVVSDNVPIENLDIKTALAEDRIAVKFTSELAKDNEPVKVLAEADLGITGALAGVTETGTVVIPTRFEVDRLVSALPPIHIVLLERERLIGSLDEVAELAAQLPQRNEQYTLSLITGPSATADIEQILVRGIHGPHSLYVLIIE